MGIAITFMILFFLAVVFVVGGNIVTINLQKQKIQVSAEKKGWKALNISFHFLFGWDNPYGYQNYDVDFVDEKGRTRSTKCKLRGPWSGVTWQDELPPSG